MDPEVPLKEILDRFEGHLAAAGKSANTLRAYTRDLRLFGEWFALTNGKGLSPERITPIDVREYRSHLLAVKHYKPATVNRKLASLAAFCEWARETGLVPANPVQGISLVEEVRPAPKWLDKRAQFALLREEVTPHTLRHTFGKNLVDAGVPLDRVAQLLGHESVDTTRIYTTPSEQDLQREVEKVAMV